MSDYLSVVGGQFYEWMDYLGVPSSPTTPIYALAGIAGVAVAAHLFLNSIPGESDLQMISNVDYGNISIPTPDGRISALCMDGNLRHLAFDECATLWEIFQRGRRVSNNGRCLGWRPANGEPYSWLSYSEVEEMAWNLGAGLDQMGVASDPASVENGKQTFIGIYSQNNPKWLIAAEAAWMYRVGIVPLYDTLGPAASSFIINQAKTALVIVDTAKKALSLLEQAKETPVLRHIVMIHPPTAEVLEASKATEVQVHSFDDIVKVGADMAEKPPITPPTPEDLAVVCYTSGTTGDPKGAMLTHGNCVATVSGVCTHMNQEPWKSRYRFGPEDVSISYLPLAHTFEQAVVNTLFAFGGCVGFYQGDIKLLMDDMKTLRPTVFPVVPRLLNRIYDGVLSKVSTSRIKEALFNLAMSRKSAELERGIYRNDSIWDKLVFSKVHGNLGGRVKAVFSGSAPLDPKVMTFARNAFGGAFVMEGYGQTECAAVACLQMPMDTALGAVGGPLVCTKVKLVDVPDMNYFASQGKGEIVLKGHNVGKGYLNDPEKTKETWDEDGWLHTGDIGTFDSTGALKVVDRKKNIFKMSQGEYIAPEKIENVYSQSSYVAQIFVHGESLKSCLVAVIVPEKSVVENWWKKYCGSGASEDQQHPEGRVVDSSKSTYESIMETIELKSMILEDLVQLGKKNGLAAFEQVKDIILSSEMWTIENNFLTPTYKAKRNLLMNHFYPQIQQLYEKLW